MTDAQVEAACATLKRAIEAAVNGNQAGEDFVIAAAEAPALLEALEGLEAYLRQTPHHNALEAAAARAAIRKAKGEAQ